MEIVELNDYRDQRLQDCFRAYFAEIGEQLQPNTKVFDRMQAAVTEQRMHCLVLKGGDDICGFIQFQSETLTHAMGFFTETLGFIREFWIRPDERGKGHGARLLAACEEQFHAAGIRKLILTYEADALGFYEKYGYHVDPSYIAENEQGVVTKLL